MQENWYFLEKLEAPHAHGIFAQVMVPSDSPWFAGHFPDNPVLPAVAQLAIALDVIERASGRKLIPESIQRTKYRRIIRPDEHIHLTASPTDEQRRYAFQMRVADETACKGTMKIKHKSHE
ncbi:MAG: 3-hydroxyacyl-ACP dehydratase FabZ family protein [Thermodesulfobacteriota bacterium]